MKTEIQKKLEKQTRDILKSNDSKKAKVFTLERKHFKKTLQQPSRGVSAADLKPTYFKYYQWLLKKYGQNVLLEADHCSDEQMSINIYIRN